MRTVTTLMTDRWKQQAKAGDARPAVRATVQNINQKAHAYNTADAPGGNIGEDRDRIGHFTSIVMGDDSPSVEIRNIKTFTWSRSVDQDIAESTMVILNTDLVPVGNSEVDVDPDRFDLPGQFTYNRGDTTVSVNRWGYVDETGWNARFVPDRLVRTYEGYGADSSVGAAFDTNLMQSGSWLIDTVSYRTNGDIEIKMRDIGRLFIDQICFPPIIPFSDYPMTWSAIHSELVPGRAPTGGSYELLAGGASSSNAAYIGSGITDTPQYVSSSGGVQGHYANDARDEDDENYWFSTGQVSATSKVWWQVDLNSPQAVSAIRITTKGGPYRIYISLADDDGWLGKRKIPYKVTTGGVNNGAGIPFLKSLTADNGRPFDIVLNRKHDGIRKIRITFAQLVDSGVGKYPFHAGLRKIKAYTGDFDDLGFENPGSVLKVVGNYYDWSNVVKWIAAWAGFFWPEGSTGQNFIQFGNVPGEKVTFPIPAVDTALPIGRVWGDIMMSYTSGQADITPDQFDKQPLLDVVNYVRDITGFSFWIDEIGAVVWRMPNLWSLGNYLTQHHLDTTRTVDRVDTHVTLDETETLLDYSVDLSSRNVRERVFVANSTGKVGTVVQGFNPYPANMRRIAGWTDQHFKSSRECRVAADMIAARQMFSYRTSKATIPGYPAIQIDDQVRVFERVTNETYFHYVRGITSSIDMHAGKWTYELDMHWLGERPSDAWAVRVNELSQATQQYLHTLGVADSG